MRRFQDTPAFWRYFGARLKPFTRPLFLGSVGFLTLSGIAIYEYWKRPDWLQNQIEQPLEAVFGSRDNRAIPQVAEEDLAAVADIDNIELLLQEIEQNQLKNPLNPTINPKKRSPDNAFTRFKKKQEDKFKNSSISQSNYLGTKNNALDNLLKPPSLTNYRSNLSTKTSTLNNLNGLNSTRKSNPVGHLYLSNKNSSFNRNLTSPYTKNSPLSNLGDRSGNFNLRQLKINSEQETNTPENAGNLTDRTRVTNPNTRLDRQINIPIPNSSVNESANIQNGQNSLRTNNINRYTAPTPNYNQSVPNNYQLQPQSFGQQTPRNLNQTNYRNTLVNPIQPRDRLNNNILSNSTQTTQNSNISRQSNNQPIINQFSSPILQPAGSLSTSPFE